MIANGRRAPVRVEAGVTVAVDDVACHHAPGKEAIAVHPPVGGGRKSEFRASKGLVQLHGYRVSILNSNRGITGICHCAEKEWEKRQAAFDKIIETISRGTPTL